MSGPDILSSENSSISGKPAVNRLAWVDVARGVGIILVVYAHALRGHFASHTMPTLDASSPVFPNANWAALQDRVIYAFHMPLFFLLSGLFLWGNIQKDWRKFLSSRFVQLVYPYLLWSGISFFIKKYMHLYVNSPPKNDFFNEILVNPVGQYWFVYSLFAIQIVIMILSKSKLAIIALALLDIYWGVIGFLNPPLAHACQYFPIVVLGMVVPSRLKLLAASSNSRITICAFLLWAAFAGIFALGDGLRWEVHWYLLGILGTFAMIASSMIMTRLANPVILIALGRASFAIYVLHTIFSAGARIALGRLGVAPDTGVSFIIAVIAGLALPYMIWIWADHRGLGAMLGLGGGQKSARRLATSQNA